MIASILLLVATTVTAQPRGDQYLRISFIDVGQGDAIWIQTPTAPNGSPGKNIIIDGGPDRHGKNRVLAYLTTYGLATYFKVQSTEKKIYLLRYDVEADEWTLQSRFDGDELLARPSIEVVTVDSAIAKKAEQRIESCEQCHPDGAEIPFDWILADVTGRRGPYEFMLTEPARCPNCKQEITEKRLVEPKD
jgi:hypothetical protein